MTRLATALVKNLVMQWPVIDLTCIPTEVKGSPHHTPAPGKKAERHIKGFKYVGAFIGDPDWAAD